jgi:hypothetical protein
MKKIIAFGGVALTALSLFAAAPASAHDRCDDRYYRGGYADRSYGSSYYDRGYGGGYYDRGYYDRGYAPGYYSSRVVVRPRYRRYRDHDSVKSGIIGGIVGGILGGVIGGSIR